VRNTGIAFVVVGVVTGAVGTGLLFAEDAGFVVAIANLLPLGGTLVTIGVPFWALGASEIPAAAELRSEGMMIGGTVLAGIGAGTITVSAFFVAASEKPNLALVPLSLGGAALLSGAVVAGYGATFVMPGEQALDLSVGPSGLEFRGSF
jgi:hypothetical protein